MCLAFEVATGLDAVEVTVDLDLQQDGRVVCRPTGFSGDDPIKTESAEVEFIDEYIDYPHWIGVRDVIIQWARRCCR